MIDGHIGALFSPHVHTLLFSSVDFTTGSTRIHEENSIFGVSMVHPPLDMPRHRLTRYPG